MNNSFLNLIGIQFREFVREPESLFWALVFPVVLSGVLGLAFIEKDTVVTRVAVVQNAHTTPLKQRLAALPPDTLGNTQFAFQYVPREEAFLELKRGEVALLLEPLPTDQLAFHLDPRNETARLQYLALDQAIRRTPNDRSVVRPVLTQGSRYIDFLIPGMIAFGVMNSCIWGISWGLIEWRIKKLLRRMVATPMSRAEFLLAHFTTRFFLCLIESVALLLFARAIFQVRVQGSPLALAAVYLSGVAAFGGIAMLVAARPQRTQVGSGLVNFITLSLMVLSGIFFNYTNFPEWAVQIIRFLPLALLADTLRAVFNEGAGLARVAGPVLILCGYAFFGFWLGLRTFRWY